MAALQKLVDVEASTALTSLYEKIVASGSTRLDIKANTVKLPPMDRSIRGQVHQVSRFPIVCLFTSPPNKENRKSVAYFHPR